MSHLWTDELVEPLASRLRERRWLRIEERRGGGWLLLADEGQGDGVCWYELDQEGGEPRVFSLLRDRRLREVEEVVARWLRLGCSVTLLAHRVGSRAVFRVDRAEGTRIAKIYRKNREIPLRWGALPADARERWSVPAVLEWDADHHVLEVECRPGTSLHRRWMDGGAQVEDGARILDLLNWLSSHPIPAGLPVFTVPDEQRVLEERRDVFLRILATPPPSVTRIAERVLAALAALSDGEKVLGHRDLHDKQILLAGSTGTLIDLDLLAVTPRFLDAGNILAHLRLRALKGAAIPWQELASRISGPLLEQATASTLHVWTASTLLRLALIYARRQRGPSLVEDLLRSTEDALSRGGEWAGLL